MGLAPADGQAASLTLRTLLSGGVGAAVAQGWPATLTVTEIEVTYTKDSRTRVGPATLRGPARRIGTTAL